MSLVSSALIVWKYLFKCPHHLHLLVPIWDARKQFEYPKWCQDRDFVLENIFMLPRMKDELAPNDVIMVLYSTSIYKNALTKENTLSLGLYGVVLLARMQKKRL